MQHTAPGETWVDWLNRTGADDLDEATKLAALREIIYATAKEYLGSYVTPAWANKKLASLGITERIAQTNTYTLKAIVSGLVSVTVLAANRGDAMDRARESLKAPGANLGLSGVALLATPTFTGGPEDVDPTARLADAPTTVDATLAKLREIIMLGHIAGPKYCEESADEVLADFGLDLIPDRRQYVVTRPVQATMRTVVEAYDEASAERVAGWRWDNDRSEHTLVEATASGDPSVDIN